MNIKKTEEFSKQIRKNIILAAFSAGAKSAHIGGALSIADIISVLFGDIMNLDSKNPLNIDRERFILSKGHACLALYSVLAEKNFIKTEDLKNFGKSNSNFLGHPTMDKKKGICIICTKDRLTKRRKNQNAYSSLKPCFQGGVIRVVGEGRGRYKSLMHHKFLVGLDAERQPLWVVNGSFNMTENALNNIENCMELQDPDIAESFFQEFKRIHRVSTPLKIVKHRK